MAQKSGLKFSTLNIATGWAMFLISAIVYIMTVEPTVSFWDCGEFILSAFKLQVGHPPGAPVFLIVGRVFTLFAGGDTSRVALMINIMSALASAFTIMFLFWTITHLARKVIKEDPSGGGDVLAIIFAGVIGSLAYAFSDTFWFSAVEGEVYATSSLFTALVFWAMLKWENEEGKPFAGRWIILIAYLMGLSIGIHLLNLLSIPALVLIYYFKKYPFSWKGLVKALIAGVLILGALVFILIPGVAKVAGLFERVLVNGFGLPYNSGLYLFIVALIATLAWGIRYSLRRGKVLMNYIFTVITVIMIGYSSFALIMIRASAKPPMNQNAPEDVFSFLYYINREQYGSAPLFSGQYFSAPVVAVEKKTAGYNRVNGKYEPYYSPEYRFDERFNTIFPRMYSSSEEHESAYNYWGQIKGIKYTAGTTQNRQEIICPTFSENLRFFFRYQIGYMYLRYFMWNFAGRQNDIQGNGNVLYGNWISGIKFIDEARLGDLDSFPGDLKTNRAMNKLYFLPLIAGLLGLMWQYKRDKSGFWPVVLFFIMTGLAIVVYLNQSPEQPRERDYAYAGSFYVFAIWIGMSLLMIRDFLKKYIGSNPSAIVSFLLLIGIPVLMASENWNDHDRSGRYTARDIGANYLNSCAENAIIFTYGDNDSFPLWYVQDVEGIRTDVRVANLSYLQAGWYIDMMLQKAYESEPLPATLPSSAYAEGKRNQLPVDERVKQPVDIKKVVEFAGLDDRNAMVDVSGRGDFYNYIPVNKFIIPVNSEAVIENGTVPEKMKDRILSPMIWEFKSSDALKNDLFIMDLFAGNNWKRPIYFSTTVPGSQYKGLESFFVQEGLAYRVTPIVTDKPRQGEFGMQNNDISYDNLMNRFKWGNASDPKVYLDENNKRMFLNFRRMFGRLGLSLLEEGDTIRARAVALRGLEIVPEGSLQYDYFAADIAETMIRSGMKEEGLVLLNKITVNSLEYLELINNLPQDKMFGLSYPAGVNIQALISAYNIAVDFDLQELRIRVEADLNRLYAELYGTGRMR